MEASVHFPEYHYRTQFQGKSNCPKECSHLLLIGGQIENEIKALSSQFKILFCDESLHSKRKKFEEVSRHHKKLDRFSTQK